MSHDIAIDVAARIDRTYSASGPGSGAGATMPLTDLARMFRDRLNAVAGDAGSAAMTPILREPGALGSPPTPRPLPPEDAHPASDARPTPDRDPVAHRDDQRDDPADDQPSAALPASERTTDPKTPASATFEDRADGVDPAPVPLDDGAPHAQPVVAAAQPPSASGAAPAPVGNADAPIEATAPSVTAAPAGNDAATAPKVTPPPSNAATPDPSAAARAAPDPSAAACAATADGTVPAADPAVRQQAARLAERLDTAGTPIRVSVTDDPQSLLSRPTATLAATTTPTAVRQPSAMMTPGTPGAPATGALPGGTTNGASQPSVPAAAVFGAALGAPAGTAASQAQGSAAASGNIAFGAAVASGSTLGSSATTAAATGSAGTSPSSDPSFATAVSQAGNASAATAGVRRAGPSLPTGAAERPVVRDVSVHITRAAAEGRDRIDIQLRPESLGRVEVRLDVGADGHVRALVLADTRDALDLLRADARALEQALQNAGLKTDGGGLDFGLRDHAGHRSSGMAGAPAGRDASTTDTPADAGPDTAAARPAVAGNGRLDIRA